jgi:hypothetical protein
MDDIGAIQLAVKVDYKQLTGLIKTTDQTKRAVSLLAKDFARTKDQSKYMSGINRIDAANRKLGNSSGMTRKQIMRLGEKVKQETRFTDALTAATTRLTVAQMTSNKVLGNTKNKMNGNNMAIQQLGYQFGDFAVQVQGGTSAFVAFSQQGSQLAGILPMIAGPLGLSMGAAVGLSAALGILIPIGSAVARMFFEMSGTAEKSAKSIDDFVSSLSSIKSSADIGRKSIKDLRQEFGVMAETVKELQGYLQQVSVESALTSMSKAVNPFSVSLAQAATDVSDFKATIDQLKVDLSSGGDVFMTKALITEQEEGLAKLQERFKVAPEMLSQLQTALTDVQKAVGLENIRDKSADALKFLESLRDTSTEISPELNAIALELQKVFTASSRATAQLDGFSTSGLSGAGSLAGSEVLEGENEQANIRRRIREEVAARKKAKDELAKYSSDLADAERLLGEQAVAANVKNIMLTREAETKAREEREKAVLEGIAIFRAANKKAAAEKEELETRAFNRRFEAEDQLMSMPLKVDKATQKKIDDAVELNRKQDDFLAKQKVQLGIATRISGQTGEELFAAQQINEMVLFKLELDKLELKSGDEKYNQLVAYKELMQEAEARTFYRIQLEKEAAEAKRIADAEAQRVNDILLDQYSRIEKELEDQAQKQKGLADGIANTFGNAFMSIVDGTESAKDAFRSMARDIIKQLYQILVVEQMVNSISGAIQGSFGGAPQGPMPSGNVVPDTRMFKLANGGVIGGPTSFRTSSGQSGLMGEAGPEAIMPLKRGANGKLGVQMEGGGATTVVQNFSFSANGDESVKRIIAQAAPKIAQMTKSEIINDRRRGGTMKATFG